MPSSLPRSLGRWTLVGLVLNGIVGSSVFGLPSVIAGLVGDRSPWPWLLAGLGMVVVVLCFAEVASRFREAGGAYLYARVAWGSLAGIEMGWLLYLVRLTAAATNANLLVISLGEFWPELGGFRGPLVLAGVLGALGILNVRGVSGGAAASNLLSLGKVVPLALFAAGGVALVIAGAGVTPPRVEAGAATWLHAILLLVFAYGGFEAALFPLAEARDPERDAPFALLVALGTVTVLYTLTQFVVSHALPSPAEAERPVVAAARALGGEGAATVMAWTAVISVTGYLAGATLNVPRLTYAMAEQGDLPGIFQRLHPRYRTPWVSVLVYVTLVWLLAASGSFLQNLTLSAVSRLLTYGAVCLAMLRMRQQTGIPSARFVVPAGRVVALLGVGFGLLLLTRTSGREALVLAGTVVAALMTWLWRRRG